MSVIIKGMDMPESCRDCKLVDSEYCTCVPMGFYNDDYYVGNYDKERAPFCPLVEVPTPHGKLIDADAMLKAACEWQGCRPKPGEEPGEVWPESLEEPFWNASTVIEAEEG